MALVPAYEITNNNEVPPLGSVQTKISDGSELDRKDHFEIEEFIKNDVRCITTEHLEAICENKANIKLPWIQDIKTINKKNVILVQALKVRGKETSSTEYHGQPIRTSVRTECEGEMVMIFSQPIDAKRISTLQHILKDALVENAKPQIPQSLDSNFKFANLYFNGEKSTAEITSLKMSLEIFCSFMNAHLQITSDIVVKPSNAMDGPVTIKVGEQVEEVNPMEYDYKDTKCLMYQKHSSFHHGNSKTTKDGNTLVSMNYSWNYNMPNAEVQDKALGSSLHSNDETHTDSKKNNHQRNSKTQQSQLCVIDPNGNEFGSYRNTYALKKASRDLVLSTTNSSLQGMHAMLDGAEKPLSTGFNLQYQDKSAPVLQDKSAQISNPCSVSVNYESLSTEHSIGEHQSRYIEFCSLSEILCDEDCSGLKRKYFGVKSSLKEEKVIILIGNQGSGKTALVNFAANFLKGVEDVDDKLYYIIMDKINGNYHTSSVTAYTFCFAEDAAPITIIDTPGLRDCKETEKSNPLQTLKNFFTSSGSNIQLHAIGYVISSSAVDLTSAERNMIDFLVEHYGQGISTNFITIVTFVDTMKNYPHNELFKNYGINSKFLLKFNNTAFNKKELDDFDRGYWKMGSKNWKRCINHLKKLPPLTIKVLKVKQKQIYSSYMVKSVEEKLKNELKSFILAYKKINSLTTPIQEKSEQVWRSAVALYHLTSSSDCTLNVESVLVKYVDEVAQETFFSSKECVILLSLCPSRGLLEAGKRMIEFMEPIYAQTKFYGLQKTPMGKKPEVLFCKKCNEQHKIKRVENKSKNSDAVIYHCTDCSCGEGEHVKPKKPGRSENKCNITKEFCLKHTKKAIEKILQEFSVPGHELNTKTFMEIVRQNLDGHFRDFIDCIVNLDS